jgi:hypothetical protein
MHVCKMCISRLLLTSLIIPNISITSFENNSLKFGIVMKGLDNICMMSLVQPSSTPL